MNENPLPLQGMRHPQSIEAAPAGIHPAAGMQELQGAPADEVERDIKTNFKPGYCVKVEAAQPEKEHLI